MWYTKGLQINSAHPHKNLPHHTKSFLQFFRIFSSARPGSIPSAFRVPQPLLEACEGSVNQRVVNLLFPFQFNPDPVQQHKALCCPWTGNALSDSRLLHLSPPETSSPTAKIPSRHYNQVQLLWKCLQLISHEIRHAIIIWPSDGTSGHLSKEMKACIHTQTCTLMLTAALIPTVLNWKQFR